MAKPPFDKGLGGLIQLDGRDFGAFYGKLKDGFAQFMAAYATTSMWITNTGDGLMAPLAAQELKYLIKGKIDRKRYVPGTWDPTGIHQVKLKEAFGYFPYPWKMTASVYENVVATKRGNRWIVGVDKRSKVSHVGFGGKKSYRGKISVEQYAAWMEFGTENQPERPLFIPAANYYAASYYPALMELVRKTYKNVAKRSFVSEYKGKTTGMGDIGNVMGEASLRAVASSNPAADFLIPQSAVTGEIAQLIKDGSMSGNAKKNMAIIFQEDKKDIDRHLSKSGITMESLMADGKSEAAAREIMKYMKGFGL